MKRVLSLFVMVGALAIAVAVQADTKDMKGMKMPVKPAMLKGELVDMGCYVGHAARGEKHKDCATKCVAGGMPMGLLTSDNKLYVLTVNHDNADAYNKCKDMMAGMVEVTGTVSERNGVRVIDVTDVKPAATAAN
jgi:hypothetical protein